MTDIVRHHQIGMYVATSQLNKRTDLENVVSNVGSRVARDPSTIRLWGCRPFRPSECTSCPRQNLK